MIHGAKLPVKHVGLAEDVAEAQLFIAGNGFITGIVLAVDGGYRLAGQG